MTDSLSEDPALKGILHDPDFAVIDEGDDYIVVDKPAHLLVHPSKPGNPPTLLDGLEGLLAFDRANGARLSIITRLDRETSGLVLVAKNPDRARDLSTAMQERRVRKEYLALVWGWPEEDRFEVDAALRRKGEVEASPIWLKRMVHPEGAPCRTEFEVVERFEKPTSNGDRFAVVRAKPKTGRMHQIRVHLAHAGHSIVGDKIYGPSENCYLEFIETGWTENLKSQLLLPRHALHAAGLGLTFDDGREFWWESPLRFDLANFVHM